MAARARVQLGPGLAATLPRPALLQERGCMRVPSVCVRGGGYIWK